MLIYLDNACFNNPCLNGATCRTSGTNYVCTCPAGYSGTTCNICNIKYFINFIFQNKYIFILKIDNACFNNPCFNGATCQTTGSSYICICAKFYSGTNCKTCKIYLD